MSTVVIEHELQYANCVWLHKGIRGAGVTILTRVYGIRLQMPDTDHSHDVARNSLRHQQPVGVGLFHD